MAIVPSYAFAVAAALAGGYTHPISQNVEAVYHWGQLNTATALIEATLWASGILVALI